MTIYLDYVFLINFLFDFILLFAISIILKRNVRVRRIIFGSLFGGLSIFILFVSLPSLLFFILKILFGVFMLIISFGFKSIKYTFNNLVYLIVLSIILGGSLYLVNIEFGYEHTGLIFFTNGFSINSILLITISIFVVVLYIKFLKNNKKNKNYYKVDLYFGNRVIKLNGFLDTGNNLYDPYFNKPILILNGNFSFFDDKFVFVPFNTIDGVGIMKCYFVDKIFIESVGFKYNLLVGLSNDKFHLGDADIILHKELMEE